MVPSNQDIRAIGRSLRVPYREACEANELAEGDAVMRKLAFILFTFFVVVVAPAGLMAFPAENAGLGIGASAADPGSTVSMRKTGNGELQTVFGRSRLIASGLQPIASGENSEKIALVFLGMSLFGFAAFMRRRTPEAVINSSPAAETPQAAGLATVPHQ
jgi:hypothetical protein